MKRKVINLPMSLKTYIDDVRASEGKISFGFISEDDLKEMDSKLDLKNQTIRDLGVIFQTMYSELYKYILNEFVILDVEHHTEVEGHDEQRYKEVRRLYTNLNNLTYNDAVDKIKELDITIDEKYRDKDITKLITSYSILTINGTPDEIENGFDISKIRLTDSTHTSEFPLILWKYLYDKIN